MKLFLFIILFVMATASLEAANRFPKPEFDTNYDFPPISAPNVNSQWEFDASVIFVVVAMAFVAYFALRKRSRFGVAAIMLVSLLYLGFYRHGCLCAVGSLQNVALGLAEGNPLPWGVVILFLAPLVFALFVGRVFCGGVCPLGAIQDVVVFKPIKVSIWLEHVLGMIPYAYLGLAVLYAATGSAFIICEKDPFVGLFRIDGAFIMIASGVVMLLLSIFVGRPYCRFLCPYGVLLRGASLFAKFKVSITPDKCVQCRLCEEACPFGAIRRPTPTKIGESRAAGRTRLAILIIGLPVMMALFGWGLSRIDFLLARGNAIYRLAERIRAEELNSALPTSLESQTFNAASKSKQTLFAEAKIIQNRFRLGGWILGAFLGLVIAIKLISLSMRQQRLDYTPDPMKCLSCGRCYKSCPIDRKARESQSP